MAAFLHDLAYRRQTLLHQVTEFDAIWQDVQSACGIEEQGLVRTDLARLDGDLSAQRFTIGVFGLIKRGKSTLLNALLGTEVSATHVTPETAVPVYVEHGDQARTEVHLATGEVRELAPSEAIEWTSQKHNAGNRRGVTHVRWALPSDMLKHGVRLVDTPGLDDAEADELYTTRTIQELDAADAGIVVFMSPPSVGATEMSFLRQVAEAHLRKTLIVANFYPQHYHDLETRQQVLDYVTTRIAETTGAEDVKLYPVCAQEAWEARQRGDEAGFAAAGGTALLEAMEDVISTHTGRRLLDRVEEALDRAARVATAEIDLRLRVLGGIDRGEKARLREHADKLGQDDGDVELPIRSDEIEGLKAHLRGLINQSFIKGRRAIDEAKSVEDLERVLGRFTREVEVVTENSYRVLRARLAQVERDVDLDVDQSIASTLVDVGAVVPSSRVVRLDETTTISARMSESDIRSAAVGGLLAGSAGFMALGAALGPLGIVAGALVGWHVGETMRSGRQLKPIREDVNRQLIEVSDELIAEFDRRAEHLMLAIRESARRRRRGFSSDLRHAVRLAERAGADIEGTRKAIEILEQAARRIPDYRMRHPDVDLDGDAASAPKQTQPA